MRTLALAAAIVAALLLTACGGGNEEDDQADGRVGIDPVHCAASSGNCK